MTLPILVYAGLTTRPPSRSLPDGPDLDILSLPTGPRSSQYLHIANATFTPDQPIRIDYLGLPRKAGEIALFYAGKDPAERVGWFYTRADARSGFVERRANTLGSATGPWKACVGFEPDLSASQKRVGDYADCVDFVMAAPFSLSLDPHVMLSAPRPRAGESFEVSYSGFPPTAGRLELRKAGAAAPAAYTFTNSQATGTWQVRLEAPGTYELQIFFKGDALRARMTVEVVE